jgi:uncharacterized membrane protein
MTAPKTTTERFVHALAFEVLAIAICAPLGAWLIDRPVVDMGVLTLAISLIAMGWNMVFNILFDRAEQAWRFRRNLGARLVHAGLFELGLVLLTVPLIAWWLGMGLWQALLLDLGLVLFFVPYTMAFNWVYDWLRPRVLQLRA